MFGWMSGVVVASTGRPTGVLVGLGDAVAIVTFELAVQLPAVAVVGAVPPCGVLPGVVPVPAVEPHCVTVLEIDAVIVFVPVSLGPVVKSTVATPLASVTDWLLFRKN